jgi:hypothetical protein
MLHRRGVNLRYLGLVFATMSDPVSKMIVFAEAAARVIKNNLRWHLRNTAQRHRIPMEAPFRRLIVERMNIIILGNNEESHTYWRTELIPELKLRFYFQNFHIPINKRFNFLYSLIYNYTIFND